MSRSRMITPTHADKMMIHNGTMSGFGSGVGMADVLASYHLSGFSIGSPMYGSRFTRAITWVDTFTGIFGAIYTTVNKCNP